MYTMAALLHFICRAQLAQCKPSFQPMEAGLYEETETKQNRNGMRSNEKESEKEIKGNKNKKETNPYVKMYEHLCLLPTNQHIVQIKS